MIGDAKLKRPKGIPDSWIGASEAGHRLGVHRRKIARWATMDYYTRHRRGTKSYYCWEEMMRNRLIRRELELFQESLRKDDPENFPARKKKDPVRFEPEFSGAARRKNF
jgi:hypothetical protein